MPETGRAVYMREWRARQLLPPDSRTCEHCQAMFVSSSLKKKYCSPQCCKIACNGRRSPLKVCVVCNRTFRPGRGGAITCSPDCSAARRRDKKLEAMRRRHARRKGCESEPYVAREIFERDGWICQLCRKRVDPLARRLQGRPTLDHVIPLSLGGSDTRANVQLAHRGCNSTKRTRAVGEQLRLVG